MLPLSVAERIASGRALREAVPFRELAELRTGVRDPLGILREQNATRLQELLGLRAERMSQSPFTFYRGTAALMAADLAGEPHTGILVPSCGDAHVSNFGFYASQQRTLVFELNDFDEAAWAPREWDLNRLLASIVIAGQATARAEEVVRDAVLRAVRTYARALARAAQASPRDRYYTRLDATAGLSEMDPQTRKVLKKAIRQARKRTGERAVRRLTQADESGMLRFVPQPPTMTEIGPELRAVQTDLLGQYLASAATDIRLLMRHYGLVDVIRRVVGVGSVGTRCSLALFQDGDGHALILQTKEAGRSVLEQYGGIEQPPEVSAFIAEHGQGARVVAMQRVLQAVSDPFLGSLRGGGPVEVDLYVRQFHDMKGGIETDQLDDESFVTYARACAITLARAVAQSPSAADISGYIGGGRRLGEAMLSWSLAYAEQSRADYEAFLAAGV